MTGTDRGVFGEDGGGWTYETRTRRRVARRRWFIPQAVGKKNGACVGMGQKICVPHCITPGGWAGLSNSLWYGVWVWIGLHVANETWGSFPGLSVNWPENIRICLPPWLHERSVSLSCVPEFGCLSFDLSSLGLVISPLRRRFSSWFWPLEAGHREAWAISAFAHLARFIFWGETTCLETETDPG
jgi:hypothetical protein